MTVTTAMILAAGRGIRMQHLTDSLPKPLIQVGGKTLLDTAVDKLVSAGVTTMVVNTCYLGHLIHDDLDKRTDIRVIYSDEETALETGGGIQKALPLLCQNGGTNGFFVLNADPLWDEQGLPLLSRLAQAWAPNNMDILLGLVPKEHCFGDIKDGNYFIENNRPRRERPAETNIPYLFSGIQIMHPRIFDNPLPPPPFSSRILFDTAEQAHRLGYVIHTGRWFHVGTPDAVLETERLLNLNKGL